MRRALLQKLLTSLSVGAALGAGRAAADAMTGAAAAAQGRVGAAIDASGLFTNPWPTWTGDKKIFGPDGAWKFGRQMRALGAPSWGYLANNRRPTLEEMGAAFPVHSPDYGALATAPDGAVSAVWAGHSTVLLRLEGLNVLTDPVFEQRASPIPFLGPHRAVPAAITPEDPGLSVDAVVISHNHYDHLGASSVTRLHKRFGDALRFYVPVGLKAWFKARGITNVAELEWWEQVQHPGSKVRFTLTPAQHWSARTPFDRRRTLWGGWAVTGEHARAWFAGDTGYAPVFREIGQRLGPFDLSLIPTGAYQPRGFMAPQHVDPREAVAIHREVRSKRSVAIHCCTFYLTMEPMDEPPALLQQEAAAAGLEPDEFVTLQHGASITVLDGAVITPKLHLHPLPSSSAANAAAGSQAGAGASGGGEGVSFGLSGEEMPIAQARRSEL